MARPQKDGLDYFPLDVDIDQDEKVALVEAQHGPVGFAIVIKIFMKIYRNGYFYEWGEKEQLLFSKLVNVDINLVNDVINDCLKWGLFNQNVFESSKVLTSKGIQKRYLEATGRRSQTRIVENYRLLSDEELNVYRNIVIVDINGNSVRFINYNNPQSKVKESKEKKSKESKKEEEEKVTPGDFFEKNGFGTLGPTIRDEISFWVDGNYFDEPEEIIVEAMKEAVRNDSKTISYIAKVLRNWSQHNVKTLSDAQAAIEHWKNRKKQGGQNKNGNRVAPTPKWMNDDQIVPDKPPEEVEQRAKELESFLNNL